MPRQESSTPSVARSPTGTKQVRREDVWSLGSVRLAAESREVDARGKRCPTKEFVCDENQAEDAIRLDQGAGRVRVAGVCCADRVERRRKEPAARGNGGRAHRWSRTQKGDDREVRPRHLPAGPTTAGEHRWIAVRGADGGAVSGRYGRCRTSGLGPRNPRSDTRRVRLGRGNGGTRRIRRVGGEMDRRRRLHRGRDDDGARAARESRARWSGTRTRSRTR